MAAHIFISYSTRNSEYAYRLAEQLQTQGFDVWIDNAQLRSGSNWWESIVLALRDCAAFIVIMSPEARQSKWVQREVTLADNWNKPTFPLLLDGQNWEIFVLTQFRDVSDGSLPPEKFYTDLAAHAPRRSEGGTNVTTSATLPDDDDDTTAIEEIRNPPPPDDDAEEPANLPASTPAAVKVNRPPRRLWLLAGAVVILAILAVVLPSLISNRGPSDLEMTPSTEVTNEGIVRFSQQTATAAVFVAQTETAQAAVTRNTSTATSTQELPTPTSSQGSALYPAPLEDYTVLRRYDPDQNYLAWALQADLGEPILYTGSQGGVVLEVGNCQNCGEEGASITDRGFALGAAQILNDPGWNFGYGHYVRLLFDFDHLPDSTRQTLEMNDLGGVDVVCTYSHLQKIHVQQNEILASAQVIGTVGESGNASGPFLRLECHAADDIENISLAAARSHAVDPAILFNL